MPGVNRATILGNVGKDPEIRSLNDGTQLATFSVATSETWRDKNSGERKEKTEWHNITVWGENLIKIVQSYVHKGDKIYLEGKIETRKWVGNDGQDRYSTGITLKGFDGKIMLLGDRGRNGGGGGSGSSGGRLRDHGAENAGDSYVAPARGSSDNLDDDIPF